MEKRPSRIEFLFSLGFIFMLICAVGAFFYGVKVGTDRTEAKYAVKNSVAAAPHKDATYSQQDLVTFYHTVLLPFRDFQKQWFDTLDTFGTDASTDQAAALKALRKTAQKQYGIANQQSMTNAAPLLQEAQTNYLKSLKLFDDGIGNLVNKANTLPSTVLIDELEKDNYIKNAVSFALQGQQQYYDTIIKWGSTMQSDIPAQLEAKSNVSFAEWKNYPLTVKNRIISDMLLAGQSFKPFYPHDLTAKTDQMIASGGADKLKLQTIDDVVNLLLSTDAVRSDDFLKQKNKQYDGELLPQLPFFFE